LDVLQTTHPGALHADLYCADGAFDVANVAYYKDARVATELSIASDWERRTLWTGPLVSAHC
jgi:complement component 1 Q subcomponent-binding protein